MPARAAAAGAGGGTDLAAASVAIARAGWSSAPRVVVASATAWPDLLAASSLGAPVLLTAGHALPAVVADEVRRLGASEAVVAGGPAAVGPAVRDRLRAMGLRLVEAGGADRYETAARLAGLVPAGTDAIVVSGETFADAATIASWAAARQVPLYLTRRDSLPAASQAVRRARRVVAVGGDATVAPAVVAALPQPVRLQGADRYETSVAVARWTTGEGLSGGPILVPAGSPAEAIAGGVLAGARRSPVVLAPDGPLPPVVQTFVAQTGPATSLASIVGGPAAGAAPDTRSADLVAWVNAARQSAGLAPLARDAALDERAAAHVAAMMSQHRLFHQAPACGTWGEVVGNGEPRALFDAWMGSAAHRSVILSAGAARVGSAVLTAADGVPWASLVVCS